MTEQTWAPDELDRTGAAEELFLRSWRGAGGGWYRAVQASHARHISAGGVERDVAYVADDDKLNDAVDAAHREKHSRYTGYVAPMVAPQAQVTTRRLVPQ
jgi:hypothetical protein